MAFVQVKSRTGQAQLDKLAGRDEARMLYVYHSGSHT